MPPPETSMVPISTRRSSLNLPQSTDVQSPPLHSLKQEFIDENSQNSLMDSSDILQERYRHISESSLDVHHGDSNVSMLNDNSMDVIHHNRITSSEMVHHDNSNMSTNENSVEMIVRRNSLSRTMTNIHENSLDANIGNSNITVLSEDSSCSSVMHCPTPCNRSLLHQQDLVPHHVTEIDDIKVIDLRMKMPMATVADLASTCAPSMATLQNFGVTEASIGPLPAQSAQSVESFLTNIESKTSTTNSLMDNMSFKNRMTDSLLNNQNSPITSQTSNVVMPTNSDQLRRLTEPLYLNSQPSFVMDNNTPNVSVNILSKTESTEGQSKTSPMMSFNSDRFDAFLNSTAAHIINNSCTRSEPVKETLNKINIISNESQPNILLSSQSTLMVPSVLNPQVSPSSSRSPSQVSSVSPDVILNSQISPSMMCRTSTTLAQDPILPSPNLRSPGNESNLIPATVSTHRVLLQSSPIHNSPSSLCELSPPISSQLSLVEPEKAVLLEAAVDLLQTQKKISELECLSPDNKEPILNKLYINNFLSITNEGGSGSNMSPSSNITTQLQSSPRESFNSVTPDVNDKSDFIIPISVKEMQMTSSSSTKTASEKKIEDRMIPQSFTSLTENELINFINPSCFDQGNNNYA
ncbi:hypothetical protein WA026_006598 [Henosepilachna vigintioctopunctata]|uniref:Uncharacterized protein n=1 Tax=Henosepilachna vigintioctopunctata TaxID=420089 RepID=A0AAW1UG56_9CUCU